ncbi:zinc finger protein 33A [Anastrepha obliqua]|uniref:zinc finger protein 33A n=1 Tax=Anastrepha obliqua TaxID=95512 RepID=UPI00240A5022|nr:zinc finger protein 33A [Anastrepha obliqua]
MTNFQVCRCCLRENPASTYAIFDTITVLGVDNNDCDIFEFGESLCAALLTCAPNLHLAPGDGLPEVICDHCFLRVRDSLAFRRRCEESERELKRRYADTERAIEEALHLVNLLDTKGQQVADDLGCAVGLQLTGELGPNELAMLDDILQLEEYSLEHVPHSEISTKKQGSKALIHRTVKDLRLLNDTETVGDRLQTSTNTVENRAHQEGQPASPQHTHTDSSASNTDCSSVVNAHDNTPRSRHPCPECEKKFTRKFQLKLHMISVHKLGDGLQYECDVCYKTFASRHSLSYHQRSVHSDERPFACSHCDRRFVLRTQLSSHLRIHTGEAKPRNFECLECGKRWPTKSVLRTHMRTHVTVQERPFKCGECTKAFFTRGHLNSHLLVHSGEKPFACPTCGKSYQCVGNLNNHMARQHDFERSAVRGRSATSENSEL